MATIVINNRQEWEQFSRRSQSIYRQHLVQGMTKAADEIVQAARSEQYTTGTYRDRTGNLRNSTGVDTVIRASGGPLSLAEGQALVHETPASILIVLPIGMEYATHVAARGPWPENVVEGPAPKIIDRNFLESMDAAVRRMEAGA